MGRKCFKPQAEESWYVGHSKRDPLNPTPVKLALDVDYIGPTLFVLIPDQSCKPAIVYMLSKRCSFVDFIVIVRANRTLLKI